MAIGLFQSCQKLENVADDVSLVLDTDLLYHPLMIQYVDANENGYVPQDLEIEITGPDKDKIFSLLGGQTIEADGHYVNLGVRKIESPSVDNPIEVSVVAKAPGYITSYKSFVLHGTDMQFSTIPMVKIGQNAPGISTEQKSFSVNSNGATETSKFATDLSYGKQEKVNVTISEGSKIYAENGSELQGEVEVVMAHFDNRHDVATKAFAGGASTSRSIIDIDGTDLGPGMIAPYGAMTLDMYANNKEVKTFSKPLNVKMTLNPNTINSETQQPIREGEEVVIASYIEETGNWQIESRETITMNAQGQLEVSYQQPHLSTWVVGAAVPPGCFFFQATVLSPISAFSTIQKFYYVELRETATNNLISSNFLQLKNNEIVTFFFVPNTMAHIDVYDGNEVCNGGLLAQSDPQNLCGFVGLIDVNSQGINPDEILEASVEVSGICDETVPTLVVAPTLTILYKDTDDCDDEALWHPLGVVSGGVGTTTALRVGNKYDFRIAEGGIMRTIREIPVPASDSTFNVNYSDTGHSNAFTFTQVIDVTYTPGPGGLGQTVNFVFHDIDIPDCACEIWRCHQNGGDPETCDPMNPASHPCNQ